jgi:ribonuclease P protein component
MLPKSKRITAQDFKGKKTRLAYRGAFFDISVSPAESTKFACIISKKRIKKAVDRNSVKRKIYTSLGGISTKQPFFAFIYPTKNALHVSYKEIEEEINKAFATL